ncbi:hypothetical protein AY599_00085 [Leptolyngbya valderiana BDU 20041]|uniref:DUF1824 family protein n=1 Tax=Baaleninema simplex TaxID=2862350 RepID=UPI00034C8DF6|nr:DUF1824 family protein [Baaleninema simplex]MDC0832698.1 DUF1824 family protein [Geitlerinema sp. CS-897]OAB61529.1 hypothetical protein AY599_00085 [Leptolyngbya valderiana BDU 20041]
MSDPLELTVDEAQTLLKQVGVRPNFEIDRAKLRRALFAVRPHCDYQIFGVCAETAEAAIAALHHYTEALEYDRPPTLNPIEGSVYVKYNPYTGLCYINSYTGSERGVLVSCQSSYDDGIRDIYGHLPLDLFD